jgi:gliding motility-associated-like protein
LVCPSVTTQYEGEFRVDPECGSAGARVFARDTSLVTIIPSIVDPVIYDTLTCLVPSLVLDAGSSSTGCYNWSTGATTRTITVTTAGIYKVLKRNSSTICDSTIFDISHSDEMTVSRDSLFTNTMCFHDSSGIVTYKVTKGLLPYNININGVIATSTDSINTFDFLGPGSYYVLITDQNGCSFTDTFIVTEPTRLILDSLFINNSHCMGSCSGLASIYPSGGTPFVSGYKYLWSRGDTTYNLVGLCSQTYYITVSDSNLCSIQDSVVISSPITIVANIDSSIAITCNNSNNGQVYIGVSGGTPPYSFSIDGTTFVSTNIFTNLSPGNYTFYVRDTFDCESILTDTFINPLAIEPYMISMRPESCPGKADGNVVIATTYGVPGFQYSTDNVTYGFSSTLGGLTTNSYTAYVRDNNGCIDSVNVSVGLRAPLLLDLDSVNVRCNNGNDGIVIANLVGGEAPYQYQLGVAPFTSSNTFNTLAAGFYTVNIRDTNNCITSASIVVNQPVRIQPTILSTTTVTCFGQTDGSVTLGHVNGSAPFSYSVDAGPFGSSNIVSGFSAGSHIAYVKDSTNCIDSISFSTGNPSDIVTLLTARTNVSCFGGNDGRLQVSSTGGASTTYTYAWSNGDIGNFADSLTVGTYYVTTTDSNACFVIDTFIITQPSLLVNSLTSTSLLCYGNTNATIISTTSGGTPAYSYLWNDPSAQTTPTAIGLSAGTYTVTVTDILGCMDVDSMTILQPDSLSLSYVSTNITCYGGFNGTITASGGGGTGVISYSIGGAYQLSGSFTGLTPGLYILTVKDANNCTKSLNLTLTQPLRIIPTILSLRNELCNGDRNAAVQLGHTNGFAPFQYTLDKILYQLSDSFTSLAVGNYRAYVVDSLFCIDSINFTITEPAPITISTVPTMNKCFGDSTGGMTFTARGGSTPYSYSIDNGTTYQSSNAFTSLVAGTYFIKVRDNNGCMGSASFTLVNPPKYIIDATAFDVLCWDSENGSIQIANTGGTPPYANYQYSRDNISFLTSAVSNIINLAGGFYYIEAFDGNGCLASDTATIGKPPIDVFSITVDSTTCYGPQYLDGAIHVDATANPPYTFSVDGGPQELNANLYGLGAGPHLVIASNRNGCIDSMMVTIPSPPPIIVDVIPDTVFLALGASIPVLVVQQNAVNETYLWSSGLGLSCIDCKDPIVSAYNDIVYQVKVYDHRYQFSTEDCYGEATLYVFVEDHVRSYLPNAFVPGKGGENATFKIYGEGIKLIRWSVYDRWGEKLFESNRQDIGWDGTYKGSLVNPGVYVYFVEAEYLDGQRETYSGSVTVLR